MAQPPFERRRPHRPAPGYRVRINRSEPLAVGLRSLLLFDDPRLTDIALPARSVVRRGSLTLSRGAHGGQVVSAMTGTVGAPASPCLVVSPTEVPASAFSISAMVHFNGIGVLAGSYNPIGAMLAADATGKAPLFVATSGSFRTRVPAETEFLSSGAHLLVSSMSGWHRLTVTVTGATSTLYVDGGSTWVGTAAQAFANFAPRSVLGSDIVSGTEWPWPVADLFYWNRCLIADEVVAHASAPYRVIEDPLSERWIATALPAAAPEIGDPWDDVFTDDFGAAMAYGTIAQTEGLGRLYASAVISHQAPEEIGMATIGGTAFLQIMAGAVQFATAGLAGTGSVTGAPIRRAAGMNGDGVGTLTANARVFRTARLTMSGVGAMSATPGQRYASRAASQGVAGLSAYAVVQLPRNRAEANLDAVGGLSATPVVAVGTPSTGRLATIAGSATLSVVATILKERGRGVLLGTAVIIARPSIRRRPSVRPGLATGAEPNLVAMELETYIPGSVPVTATAAHGTRAHGTLSRLPPTKIENTGMILASDIGYRTAPSDPGGPTSYPPLLSDAYQIDAALTLEPTRTAASAAWGTVLLANPNGSFDAIANVQNSDGRSVRLLVGSKTWASDRQYLEDPSYSRLSLMFAGLATPWALSDSGLQVPLRDASYWLEKPLQIDTYGGSGALDGTSDLAGKPKPMARGGTASAAIQNVAPVLVDPTNYIYQYSDGPGQVIALYEGGATGTGAITWAGDTTNLYAGTTPYGRYRTDNSRGLFQLGSSPVSQITVDVVGYFPIGGAISHPFLICQRLLTEDMSLPASMIDGQSFTSLAALVPSYVAGLYFGSDDNWTCVQAIDSILASIGANLIPTRDGRLRLMLLRAIDAAATPVASFDTTEIISVSRKSLPSSLDPPPYRFRVGYSHNFTVMSSGVNTSLATQARQQFIASADRYATWYDAKVLAAYRRPNDFQAMPGPLLTAANALDVAQAHMALWGIKRRLYDVTLPRMLFGCEIGDIVHITYPVEQLATGANGRIVGYSLRSTDATVVYSVLV